MQDNSLGIKQQVAERIKKANNILITVSANPSVDALSAMLALTLIVNKLDKHGAAVFSGVVPPAINFLKPNKTFENNVDSLRDFIIALDKDKADRLRYKVEDDVVKIFITPYKTTITEKDLQFSQGDFNVDLIIALGVEKRDELDQAIVAHGRILHDAAVITINALDQKSSLGQIDWHEGNVSSLCEMLAGIADVIKPGVLDQQISTALLTGIVAATERFSNQRTAPQVMNVAAQLMVTGANQQLIASNLQGGQLIPSDTPIRLKAPDVDSEQPEVVPAAKKPDGEMQISHVPPTKIEPELPISQPPAALFSDLKQAIADDTKNPDLDRSQNFLDSKPPLVGSKDIATTDAQDNFSKPEAEADYLVDAPSWKGRTIQPPDEPSLGGALSATIDQAEDDKRRSDKADQNKQILTHGGSVSNDRQPPNQSSQPAIKQPKELPVLTKESVVPTEPYMPPPMAPAVKAVLTPKLPNAVDPTIEQIEQGIPKDSKPTTPEIDLQAARAEVDSALESMPAAYEPTESIGSRALPPVSAASMKVEDSAPPAPIGQLLPEAQLSSAAPDGLDNRPPLPPMPDFSKLPSLPPVAPFGSPPDMPPSLPLPQNPPQTAGPAQPAQASKPQDPGQFHIPGL